MVNTLHFLWNINTLWTMRIALPAADAVIGLAQPRDTPVIPHKERPAGHPSGRHLNPARRRVTSPAACRQSGRDRTGSPHCPEERPSGNCLFVFHTDYRIKVSPTNLGTVLEFFKNLLEAVLNFSVVIHTLSGTKLPLFLRRMLIHITG